MKLRNFIVGLGVASLLAISSLGYGADNTASNVTNYNPNVKTELWVLQIVGQGTETVASSDNIVASIVVPSKYSLLSVKARAEGFDNGTASNRFYVDIQEALTGTTTDASVLSSPIAIGTQSSSVTGSISDSTLADESLINVYAYGSGTSRATLQIYVERSN